MIRLILGCLLGAALFSACKKEEYSREDVFRLATVLYGRSESVPTEQQRREILAQGQTELNKWYKIIGKPKPIGNHPKWQKIVILDAMSDDYRKNILNRALAKSGKKHGLIVSDEILSSSILTVDLIDQLNVKEPFFSYHAGTLTSELPPDLMTPEKMKEHLQNLPVENPD